MNLKRIKLNEVATLLCYKDVRTAETWCKNNGISVIFESKRKYVWEKDFESVCHNQFLKTLESRYPDNYRDIYELVIAADYLQVYQITKENPITNQLPNYTNLSVSSKIFLNKIK